MKVFLIDFLVLIDLNCSGRLILESAVELRDYVAVAEEDVDGADVGADCLGRLIEADVDEERVVSWTWVELLYSVFSTKLSDYIDSVFLR